MKTVQALLGAALVLCSVSVATAASPHLVHDSSFVMYTLKHPLHTIEATSREVSYTVELDVSRHLIQRVEAVVDVTTFDSGNSNRDSHAMEVVDALTYPEVRFVSTGVQESGDSLVVQGALTFHGITRNIVLRGTGRWTPTQLEVRGGFSLSLTEFGVERPSLLMMPVSDTLEFTVVAVYALDGREGM